MEKKPTVVWQSGNEIGDIRLIINPHKRAVPWVFESKFTEDAMGNERWLDVLNWPDQRARVEKLISDFVTLKSGPSVG